VPKLVLECLFRAKIDIKIEGEKFAITPAGQISDQCRLALIEYRTEIRQLLNWNERQCSKIAPDSKGVTWKQFLDWTWKKHPERFRETDHSPAPVPAPEQGRKPAAEQYKLAS
jgi:hypothetical protein